MKTALAAAAPLAFHVREQPAQPTTLPISERQKFEKTFAIEQPAGAKARTAIQRLVVSSPGLTFVSFDVDAAPGIKVSAENTDALDAYEVVQLSDSALEIRLRSGVALEPQYILTEVSLPSPDSLRDLAVGGSGTVVLGDGVLATGSPSADVRLQLSGSGDLFATSLSSVQARTLSLDLSGSGDLQLVAPAIAVADQFVARLNSSGDVRVFTGSLRGPQLSVQIAGSGDVQLAALELDASHVLETSVSGSGSAVLLGDSYRARELRARIAGSGGVTLVAANELATNDVHASITGSGDVRMASAAARCGESHVSIAGSGSIDLRDLVARQATVSITGSGDVVVRASEALQATKYGSGSVTVVGELPPKVSGSVRSKSAEDKPSLVDKLASKRHEPSRVPVKEDAFEQLMRFQGTFNVRSFGDFITAVKMLWNHKSGDKVVIKAGSEAHSP